MEIEARKLQTKMRNNGVEPHFFYNTLEFIRVQAALQGMHEIGNVTANLGAMMRYWTDCHNLMNSIRVELEYIQRYLQISQVRYNYIFDYIILCPPEIEEVQCPRYLLELILDEIILQGVALNDEKGSLSIEVSKVEEKIIFRVLGYHIELPFLRQKDDELQYCFEEAGLTRINDNMEHMHGEPVELKLSTPNEKCFEISWEIPECR